MSSYDLSFLLLSRIAKLQNFIKKEIQAQMFFCEFCEISKNTFFIEHLQWLLLKTNKEKFLRYFKKNENTSEDDEDITITNVVTSVAKDITNAELSFAADEIKKSHNRPKQYTKQIPESVKREFGRYASIFGTSSAIKKFSLKYLKHSFIRTSVNNWKNKFKGSHDGDVALKKVGRPNILDDHLIRKVKDNATGTRQASGVVNRREILNIAKGVIRVSNPDILKEFVGIVEYTVLEIQFRSVNYRFAAKLSSKTSRVGSGVQGESSR